MTPMTVDIAALIFGLILAVSAGNLKRQGKPRGQVLPLVIIGAIFLIVGVVRLLIHSAG